MADDRPLLTEIPQRPLRLADVIIQNDDIREQHRRYRVTTDLLQQDRDEESAEVQRLREQPDEVKADHADTLGSARNATKWARSDRNRAEEQEKKTALALDRLRSASRVVVAAAERSNGVLSGELGAALAEMKRVEEELGR